MWFNKSFFNKEESRRIVEAIREAEKNTSGEIRVHIAKKVRQSILDDGLAVFQKIRMYKTAERNGILIYITHKSRQFCIIGDEGIHKKVAPQFWDNLSEKMTSYFKEQKFTEGTIATILEIGTSLKQFFPYIKGDKDELDNTISYEE